MGRGRQKAKQTKVARQLKYYSPETDLEALQRELSSSRDHAGHDEWNEDAAASGDDSGDDRGDRWHSSRR